MGRTVRGIYGSKPNAGKSTDKRSRKGRRKVVPTLTDPRHVRRPESVVWDERRRKNFVTGFEKRKEQRRIRAAKQLIAAQREIQREQRAEKKQEENQLLINAGFMEDPLDEFLMDNSEDDEMQQSSDMDGTEQNDESAFRMLGEDSSDESEVSEHAMYEDDDLVTTVVCSIPTSVDSHSRLLEETRRKMADERAGDLTDYAKDIVDSTELSQKQHSIGKDSIGIPRDDSKSKVRKPLTLEEKKREKAKLKKMLTFVKEFNSKKKRKANARFRKKPGPGKKKKSGKRRKKR